MTPRVIPLEALQAWIAGELATVAAVPQEEAAAIMAAFTEAAQGASGLAPQAAAAAAEPQQVSVYQGYRLCVRVRFHELSG